MTAYIVSYDLSQPGQNYEKVLQTIKSHSSWARLGGSAYIVISNESAVEIRDKILRELDTNDKLYVGVVEAPAAWYGMGDEVSDWLKKNL